MPSISAAIKVVLCALVALVGAGCLEPEPNAHEDEQRLTHDTFPYAGCYLSATDPEIHMYGCAEEILVVQLAHDEERSVDLDLENLTGFTLVAYSEPLATGAFSIRAGAFEGIIDVRGGKWFASTNTIGLQETRDVLHVIIDVCDTSSVTVAFQAEVEVPAGLEVHVYAHADHRHFMVEDGEPVAPTCNDTWSLSSWPVG